MTAMPSVLMFLALMSARYFFSEAVLYMENMFLLETTCDSTQSSDAVGTYPVTHMTQCAGICAEHSDCKSLVVDPSVDGSDHRVCKLYNTKRQRDNCTTFKPYYNKHCTGDKIHTVKLTCENGGTVHNGTCRCVGGYLGPKCEKLMKDCKDGYTRGSYRTDGVYTVWPVSSRSPFKVYCYMSHKNGKTYIQRQTINGGVDFNRTWDDYNVGFGNVSGDHWLGNTKIHYLTQSPPSSVLTMAVLTGGTWKLRYYFGFNISDMANHFRFNYKWTETEKEHENSLDDCLMKYKEETYRFSTFDKDNDDNKSLNCAQRNGGGWWFRKCRRCFMTVKLTGQPLTQSDLRWRGLNKSLAISETRLYLS